jgi:uncharacterized OB-fold protein
MSALPAPAPTITPVTARFWAATAQGRFELQRCDACDVVIWFPRAQCPRCWTTDLSHFDASGLGTVYSHTVIRKVGNDYRDSTPFVVAYVELDEGPRVLTNIIDCDVDQMTVGMRVQVVFHDTGKGSALYRFRPVER